MEEFPAEPAQEYFDFMARRFPVMCASDEFHYMPRAQAAKNYYDRMEDFTPENLSEALSHIKNFQKQFSSLVRLETDPEKQIDLAFLGASATGVLIEFDENRIWRCNPLLYLKVAFIGLDHALTKPASDDMEREERTLSRLAAIPGLLNRGIKNIDHMPALYCRAALEMVTDCFSYMREIADDRKHANFARNLLSALNPVDEALRHFERFLHSAAIIPDDPYEKPSPERTLQGHYLSDRSLDEVFQIALEQWHRDIEQLKSLQLRIDTGTSWQALYAGYKPREVQEKDIMVLYQHEIENLRNFFSRLGVVPGDLNVALSFERTPAYLRSIRSSASFSAAFSDDPREKSIFYITPFRQSSTSKDRLAKRLHREYKFLTAHETIPGHHLLDTVRRSLENPIRRQIESPLFYEGWAFYSETLLADFGYVTKPIERLVDYKRRLWRAARCQIDTGLFTGKLNMDNAVNLLIETGFTRDEALGQIRRFQLNPGYQLCYSLGCYEINRLKETFLPKMGARHFHEVLLAGGQIPFHFIEKQLFGLTKGRQP
jgi:uncharacterized protein (DUF885 family)